MAKPNSRTTRLRRFLVAILDPKPDPGEAWCLGCYLNGGQTRVLTADGTKAHAAEHTANPPDVSHGAVKVIMQSRWKVLP
jgi:hypothetical protein